MLCWSPAVCFAQADEPEPMFVKKPKPAAPTDAKSGDKKPDETKPADAPSGDTKPKDLSPEAIKPGAPTTDPAKPVEPARKKDNDLDSLDPNAKDRDLLEDAIRGMRKSQQLLESREKAHETQGEVVKNLDDLIKELEELLKNPPPQDPQEQQDQQPQNEQQKKEQQKKKQKLQNKFKSKLLAQILREQQRRQMTQSKPQPQPKKEEQGPKKEQAGDTSESKEKQKLAAAEEARRKLSQDVWGHLPPHLRQQLLNMYSDKYLPKYHDLVQQYFESLAQQKSRK